MRQRKIKNLDEKLRERSYLIADEPKLNKGSWRNLFSREKDEKAQEENLYLELGCGKGDFIAGMAKKYRDRLFIAVEGHRSVALRAVSKIDETIGNGNVRFILEYINSIEEYFNEGELSGIFLNFSDPWPKDRHRKRRLTDGKRLRSYFNVLKDDGFIEFKTDNDKLFEFTLEQIESAGLKAQCVTRDLHNSPEAENNIMTEYEMKFSSQGKNINFVRIVKD